MTETKPKIEFSVSESRKKIPVIVVAAGSFVRMNGTNKQLACISGIPVIIRTLLAFQNSDCISNIILVVRPDDIFQLQLLTEKYGISKLSDIVCGGSTRQDSVLKGLARITDEESFLIHDGARPLVDSEIIRAVADGLDRHPAVTCAVKVKDTVKQIDENGRVLATLPRESLVAVQTPQGVKTAEYRLAVEKAGDVSAFTDDMSVMEAAGYPVHTVAGSYKNLKITTPEDIAAAESYLKEEN